MFLILAEWWGLGDCIDHVFYFLNFDFFVVFFFFFFSFWPCWVFIVASGLSLVGCPMACGILVPQSGIEPVSSALGA